MSLPEARCLKIAGISIQLISDQQLPVMEEFAPFLTEEEDLNYTASFRRVAQLPPIPTKVLYSGNCYHVHPDEYGGYVRSFFDAPRDRSAYALVKYNWQAKQIQVDYLSKGAHCVSQMSNSLFHLGLENIMIHEQRLCFHAACVQTHLGGILFSGPSGIGKSTQADLWCRFREARLINGDRPIISRTTDGFLAWGSPYAGSSKCYVNESCRITAIVMLRQSEQCSLRRLTAGEAFRSIYAGLTMYSWDREFVVAACDMALELAERVAVFELHCTPDEAAVDCLERELREELHL